MARAVRAVGQARLAHEPGRRPGRARLMPIKLPSFRGRRETYPPDLWTKCPSCEEMIFNRQLDKTLRVCPTCGHHFRLSAAARLELLLDPDTFEERDARPPVGRPARVRRPEALSGPGRGGPGGDRACATRRSGASAGSTTGRSRSASWTSRSWAARWARSSARRSPGPPRRPSRCASRSSSSRRPVAPGCRRARSRSCSWPRRSPRSSACAPRACRSSRS